jgi:LmbE family N-acetylglucosaminyl deacetylase
VGAHPDDVEFGCGATLAKWAAAGCRIHHLVCTDGSKGTWDPEVDQHALVAARREEQRRAAQTLGARDEPVFLGWPDGELDSGIGPRWQVADWIRRLRPDVVLGHDPWKRYRLHPDHRHAGFLAVDGVVAARDPLFFPALQLAPHRPSAMLLWEADEADHVEEVTLAHARAKIDALLAHRSQLLSTMKIDGDDTAARDAFEQGVIDRLTEGGALAGVARGEAFKVITDL